jgi:cytochrome c1
VDAGHKRPWGVTALEVAGFAERFAGALTGSWAALSPRAAAGRELWVDSCASCHAGPPGTFGGTKSGRPFAVLAAHAQFNAAYFRGYIRDPKKFVPTAAMEPHPHYTEAQLDALAAFVTAEAAR